MRRSNVVLTGFMATGKSTIGRMLADALGYEWVDTDAAIEAEHGPVVEIFSANGEEVFRQMERDLATELANRQGVVISTGGGMMLDPVEAQDKPPRPLLSGDDPAARIAGLLAERAEVYFRFEQVATDGRTFAEIVADLVTRLSSG